MLNKIRPHPTIPDHEVLRKIGGGAYGEVWLARGVTGALRAVKVVWREDFEDAKTFEREFDGILMFEPMSRDHPALMNILHVGRSPDGISFYYYVMELGDDLTSGQDINPAEYEPRTLRADNAQGAHVQWDTNECIDVGLRLAEALDHLHERGLAHRDVKPSNVIFVNGRAKLADIGLVAARGQRTFVGTEGFVPPEGPGSAQADIYSLGKVLYEIATGKDRMAFPELPEVMPEGADKKRWLELNRIICDICEPRISKRKIATAAELADALRRIQRGKRRRHSSFEVWMTVSALMLFFAWVGWQMIKDSKWVLALSPPTATTPPPAPALVKPAVGMLRVVSAPEGAVVRNVRGEWVGITNTGLIPVPVGDDVFFTLKKSGYRPFTIRGKVPQSATTEPMVYFASLENFSPPQAGDPWEDHLGNSYQPNGQEHVGAGLVCRDVWEQFNEAIEQPEGAGEFVKVQQNGQELEVVVVSAAEQLLFCDWFRKSAIKTGFLSEDNEVVPQAENHFPGLSLSDNALRGGWSPFRVVVRQFDFGEITLTTQPPDVEVWMNPLSDTNNRVSVGSTREPLVVSKVKPGEWQLYLVREGYKPTTVDIKVGKGEKISKEIMLEKSLGVVFGKPWENGIGMRFTPLGNDLMGSIWETRVSDYATFTRESGRDDHRAASFPQTPDHPVVDISREDAQAFCKWLSERERKDERIARTHEYRLPSDMEWSKMLGLAEEEGISPGWRDARKKAIFPWGDVWPPDQAAGNFADAPATSLSGSGLDRNIQGYSDGFVFTSPVGSFPANSAGFYDLSGNVQDWVGDEYLKYGKNVLGVLRGGGWNSFQAESLFSGSRNAVPPTFRDSIYGFRVLLAKIPQKIKSPTLQ